MYIPDGYVQFFIPITPEDPANAEAYHDEGAWYTLRQEHLKPTGALGITANGSVIMYRRAAGEPIDGFYYAGGYQFSAELTAAASGVQQDYLFTLTNNSLNRHFVLFRPGKTFTGGKAARLPAVSSWQEYVDHEYVDMGEVEINGVKKNLKWATCNVGAENPWDYGDYYAWGETDYYYKKGHSQDNPCTEWVAGRESGYAWSSYKYRVSGDGSWDGSKYNITFNKYCTEDSYWESTEPLDKKTVLDLEDDVAHAKWGGKWRIPTDEEWTALRDDTLYDWVWTDNYLINGSVASGVSGRIVTRKASTGPCSGNSIFFPVAGYRSGARIVADWSRGCYWSSSLYTDRPDGAWGVYVRSYDVGRYRDDRYYGQSVRPVSE